MKILKYIVILFIFANISYSLPDISSISGVCIAIENFISETSKAPNKIEYLEASSIMEFENGLYAQRVRFKDSSDPNFPQIYNFIFLMNGNKEKAKVLTVGNPDEFINSIIDNSFNVRTLYDNDGTIILD